MNIYIPIEIKAREFESRLLLALIAASRGHVVIFGEKSDTISLARKGVLKPGIVHDKSMTPSGKKISSFRALLRNGHMITSQDEEHGLSYDTYDYFIKKRFSKETIDLVSKVFCWGEFDQKSLIKAYPDYSNKFILSGSPRVDLWRNEFDILYQGDSESDGKKFKDQYGNYVMIVSNFGMLLSKNKRIWNIIKYQRDYGYFQNSEEESEKYMHASWTLQVIARFIVLIRTISEKFPNIKFVIRPHPSEDIDAWKDMIGTFNNIYVIREGSINSWIRNSSAIIHNGCTSGYEAKVSGIPVIAFNPIKSKFEKIIPNSISDLYTNDINKVSSFIDDLLNKKNIISKLENASKSYEILENRFCNLAGDFASRNIVIEWEKLSTPNLEQTNNWIKVKIYAILNSTRKNLYNFGSLFPFTGKINKRLNKYNNNKINNIAKKDITQYIYKISENNDNYREIKVKKLGKNSFIMNI